MLSSAENEQAVRERAYQIWVNEGRPEGKDLDHWRRAASELAVPPVAEPAPKPAKKPRKA